MVEGCRRLVIEFREDGMITLEGEGTSKLDAATTLAEIVGAAAARSQDSSAVITYGMPTPMGGPDGTYRADWTARWFTEGLARIGAADGYDVSGTDRYGRVWRLQLTLAADAKDAARDLEA